MQINIKRFETRETELGSNRLRQDTAMLRAGPLAGCTNVLGSVIADGTRPPMMEVIERRMEKALSQGLRRNLRPIECIQ
jgi:hypothetical protein